MKLFTIDDSNVAVYANAIAAWVRTRVDDAERVGVVLGMSGGLDCSVVARLCQLGGVDAELIVMPYGDDMQNSKSFSHAMELIEKFDFDYHVFDIKPAVDALSRPLIPVFTVSGDASDELSRANVRPRVRMTYLYRLAQLSGRFVIGTGNLSEREIGYFTKWGDGASDLNPLAMVTKQEVYTLAHYLEVPESITGKKPSAGLWEGQTDEDELGMSYAQIDAFITNGSSGDPDIDRKIRKRRAATAHKHEPIPVFNDYLREK